MHFKLATVLLSLLAMVVGASAARADDLVDTAVGAGQFGTLAAALDAAELLDALKGQRPFTVFAPDDEAFAALPDGTVENLLLPENKDQLIEILTYHVIEGKVMSSDIAGQQLSVNTLAGIDLGIDASDGVSVGGATVTTADVEADNGVIHVIDTVLIP